MEREEERGGDIVREVKMRALRIPSPRGRRTPPAYGGRRAAVKPPSCGMGFIVQGIIAAIPLFLRFLTPWGTCSS
ncbi:hypothetical protein EVAR_81332_1 [Eumeta japonica]|uniref:Uncharacterized protein n=1 Tax=Eumeta variegata TaxID=151549 RepID=A0A4C1VYR7_EUMVA|nr:hypothetical protein EVAR_81332_1 [Eumeta japonica]